MPLRHVIREVVFKDIKGMDLNFLGPYSRQNSDVIKTLSENGFLEDYEIEETLRYPVVNLAKQQYSNLMNGNDRGVIFLHDVNAPACMAYALDHGSFSPKEEKKLGRKLYENETFDSYINRFKEGDLLSKLRQKLIDPEFDTGL